ncbi:hypothetical protein NKH84_22175 [Mesorhizobium sp. M0902]|uniref:hypothetical protein n=1 Tax=unclassified Mesorhizobium TaxID=325217 RepID=UPI00333D3199
MTINRIGLAITSGILLSSHQAEAQVRYTCDAVRQMAEVNVDPQLAVNVLKDPATQTCKFFVSIAPMGKFKAVFDTWDELKNTSDAAKAFSIVQGKFVPSAIEALAIPLLSPDVGADERAQWMKAIADNSNEIEKCSFETLWKDDKFYNGKDVSCGRTEAGDFLLEARKNAATLSVYLPIK